MNEHQDEKIPSLATVANFRDVSKFVKNIKPGLLFRSAQIDDASRDDLGTLRERYRIRSVIDLRGMSPWPLISTLNMPGKHDSEVTQQYPDHIASSSILGLRQHYISLAGPQYGRFLLSQMGYWERTKAIVHTAVSPASGLQQWRKTMSSQMFKDRMTLPETIIDQSLPQIKAIFQVLTDPSSYPVLILNRYGSDFVSLVVDLVLLLLHTDVQSIHRDYMQTYEDLASLKEERIKVNREQGVPDEFAEPFLPFVNSLEQHIQTKHGGIEQYLLSVGLRMSEIQSVRKILGSNSSVSEKQAWLVDI